MIVYHIKISNWNIRATPPMRQRSVVHDLRTARLEGSEVYCWQELAKIERYKQALRAVLPKHQGWNHSFMRKRNAISVDTTQVKVIKRKPHRLTDGKFWIPQPPRYANQLLVEDLIAQDPHDIYNCHFTNGGYNGRWRPAFNRRARKRLWDKQYEKTCELIAKSVNEQKRLAVVTGDFNREDMPELHPRQKIVLQDGIMKVIVIPPKDVDIEIVYKRTIPKYSLKTDKAGLVVMIRVRRHG